MSIRNQLEKKHTILNTARCEVQVYRPALQWLHMDTSIEAIQPIPHIRLYQNKKECLKLSGK